MLNKEKIFWGWYIVAGAFFVMAGNYGARYCFANTPVSLYLTYGLLVGLGATGMGVVVCSSSVGKWFIKKRGVAIGIATMGISFGTMTLTPLSGYIGKYFSWRIGLFILGIITFIVGIVISHILMRNTQPEAYGILPDGDKKPLPHQVPSIPTFTKVSTVALFKDLRFWTIAIS